MFDIGWSELVVIGVVALIAIGPKELPGVLRMVGQWMGKARRMASEFQGHFNEAMREAEMADLKKSFDDVRDAARDLSSNNIMTALQKETSDALHIGALGPPSAQPTAPPSVDEAATKIVSEPPSEPTTEATQPSLPAPPSNTELPLDLSPAPAIASDPAAKDQA
jgi:sec-independent protein translocase protein TatB